MDLDRTVMQRAAGEPGTAASAGMECKAMKWQCTYDDQGDGFRSSLTAYFRRAALDETGRHRGASRGKPREV